MKQIIPEYTFDASAKTITFTGFSAIELSRVLLITNVTTNTIIYNFAATGGTVAGNVLTLDYDTTGMADTDELSIQYETAPGDPDYARITNVETERKTWRRNFNGAVLDPAYWNTIQTGAGMTVDGGGGNLTIATGTTANSETIIRSIESFKVPFRIQWHQMLSQRIANQEFYLELTNAAGDTYIGYLFDGTTVTTAKTTHMNGGYSAPASPTAAVTVVTTASMAIREIEVRPDAVYFTDRTADSTAGGTNRAVKTRTILDPDEIYYVQMRAKNLAVAPASSTTMTVETILVQDSTKFKAEITGGTGNAATGMAIPVLQQGTVTTALTTTSLSATTSTALTTVAPVRLASVTGKVAVDTTTNARMYWLFAHNPNATDAWLHFYNLSVASTTVGTSVPLCSFRVPANGDFRLEMGAVPYWSFATACTVAATTSSDHTVATAPAVGLFVVVGNI